jgi:predicted glycosyltransferase
MTQRGLFQTIHPHDLSPERVMNAIELEIAQRDCDSSPAYRVDLNALGRVTEHLASLLAPPVQRSSAAAPRTRYLRPQGAVL